MERDQYQHWLPRFILRPFSKNDILNVYSLPTNSIRQQDLNQSFGRKNFYRSTSGDEIEKMLMNLESDTSRVFSVMKKKVDSLMRDDCDDDDADVILSDSDLRSIKKFLLVSNIRTEFYRSLFADPNGVFPPSSSPTGTNDNWICMLRLILENSPETLLEWKGDGESSAFNEATTHAIRLYQIISDMQLHIWRTSDASEEFMLGADQLVHIEGLVQDANSLGYPKLAHFILPISPSVVVIACSGNFCQQAISALSTCQHAPPREHVLPGRKRPGQKGYRPARNVWKYPITRCNEQQMLTINTRVFTSSRVVFRSLAAFNHFVESLTTSLLNDSDLRSSSATDASSSPNINEVWGLLVSVAQIFKHREKNSHVDAEIFALLFYFMSNMEQLCSSTQPPFDALDYLVSRALMYGIMTELESLVFD